MIQRCSIHIYVYMYACIYIDLCPCVCILDKGLHTILRMLLSRRVARRVTEWLSANDGAGGAAEFELADHIWMAACMHACEHLPLVVLAVARRGAGGGLHSRTMIQRCSIHIFVCIHVCIYIDLCSCVCVSLIKVNIQFCVCYSHAESPDGSLNGCRRTTARAGLLSLGFRVLGFG